MNSSFEVTSNRTILELKFSKDLPFVVFVFPSNRTILELKYEFSDAHWVYRFLLIAPYWNCPDLEVLSFGYTLLNNLQIIILLWTVPVFLIIRYAKAKNSLDRDNRTILELKYILQINRRDRSNYLFYINSETSKKFQ